MGRTDDFEKTIKITWNLKNNTKTNEKKHTTEDTKNFHLFNMLAITQYISRKTSLDSTLKLQVPCTKFIPIFSNNGADENFYRIIISISIRNSCSITF